MIWFRRSIYSSIADLLLLLDTMHTTFMMTIFGYEKVQFLFIVTNDDVIRLLWSIAQQEVFQI